MVETGCSVSPMSSWEESDSRQILSPPKAAGMEDLAHTIQAREIWEQPHRERTGDQLPEDMRLAVLLSTRPTDLEKIDSPTTFVSS